MHKLSVIILPVFLLLLPAAGTAYAQDSSTVLKGDVPFDFIVADKTLPMGTYTVKEFSTGLTKIQGQHEISTGIGFLDHMLTHLSVHGLSDLRVQAQGDLHIDVHHTVEDVALALGQAFDQALGDRKGIVRMADCFAPMDETLAHVAVDLSGRPYAVILAE